MEPFSIHDERSTKGWDGQGSSLEGQCQFLRSEYWAEVLWIDTGIVAIPLFKIDIPSSSECVGFGSELSGMETDDEVEARKIFRPLCLSTHEDLGCLKVFQVLVIGDHIEQKSRAFKVMSPSFESFKNRK